MRKQEDEDDSDDLQDEEEEHETKLEQSFMDECGSFKNSTSNEKQECV